MCAMTTFTNQVQLETAVAEWMSDAAAAEANHGHISVWNTSQITNMRRLFSADRQDGTENFSEDIDGWDTSKVTDMDRMFRGASSFNQDLNSWDTARVTDM